MLRTFQMTLVLDIVEKHTILDLLFHQMINGLTILTQFQYQHLNK